MNDDDLCECNRPDEADNPHRHTRDIECARWADVKARATEVIERKGRGKSLFEAVAADLIRNHDMPPRKDSRGYSYRMGWWDAVHHCARVVAALRDSERER